MGLVGYTGQGIYKSLYAAVHSKTKKSVASARRVQDKYFIRANGAEIDANLVLEEFDRICQSNKNFQYSSLQGSITSMTLSRATTSASDRIQPSSHITEDEAPMYQEREHPH
jgi:hypothetical protein